MTVDEIIAGIIDREGEGTPPYLDPRDYGGRTRWGIAERAHPDAWRNGPPTRDDAKRIYAEVYVAPFDPLIAAGLDDRVRVALIDDGVLSGVMTSIKNLQRAVNVPPDGVIGPQTLKAIRQCGKDRWLLTTVVQLRAHRLARIVEEDHTQARFVVGWIDRCLSFL